MKAARILRFGSPEVISNIDAERPAPGEGQVLIRVKAAGVGPWDALIRQGKIAVPQPLPLTLGSDLSGVIESVGAGVSGLQVGDEVYGVTNEQFTGAYAEYAIAEAAMIALKPSRLNFVEAASVPVVAVTAWQMLFEYANVVAGQKVLILGAAGNVGAYAVQLAAHAGLHVTASASARDSDYIRTVGAEVAISYESNALDSLQTPFDVVLDTVGGQARDRSLRVLKLGGILVSSVSQPLPTDEAIRLGVRVAFFIVDVTTARLNKISALIDNGQLTTHVGTVLPLENARAAHEMLAGAPHERGKIVLKIAS